MEKVITREWVNKHFELHGGDRVYNYQEFSDLVDRWKVLLVKKYDAAPGKTIGFTVGMTDIRYFSLFFAAAELGLVFVVYQKPIKENDLTNYKIEIFSPIDIMILDEGTSVDRLTKEFANRHSKKKLLLSDYTKIPTPTEIEDINISKKIYAEPNSMFLYTTSSGSTSTPKVIKHDHKFFYDLCLRNSEVMGFLEIDSVMHIRNLHHGSSVGVFFLPSLKKCFKHSFLNFEEKDVSLALSHIVKYKVTKILVPYNKVADDLLQILKYKNIKLNYLEIFNLSYLKPEWIEYCRNNIIKSITSIFGCNETSGPIFLPKIDRTTEQIDPTIMGELLDDFYNVKLVHGVLNIYLQSYDRWASLEDKFLFTDNKYIFLGKSNLVRVNDQEIVMEDLKNFLNQLLEYDHEIIFNEGELYLAIFDFNLKIKDVNDIQDINRLIKININPLIEIAKVRKFTREQYNYGIKLDQHLLRTEFRGKQ